MTQFSGMDRRQLAERGVSLDEARRELELLDRDPVYLRLDRPCTLDDGIVRIADEEMGPLHALHRAAADAGRFVKFTPASGAATRMFRDLFHFQRGQGRQLSWTSVRRKAEDPSSPEHSLVTFIDRLPQFAFHVDLAEVLDRQGERLGELRRIGAFQPILDALLTPQGLGYANLPKGLLKFHCSHDRARTAFEEHLVEALDYVADHEGFSRLHFTVSPEHLERFVDLLNSIAGGYRERSGVCFDVGFSAQKPSTDTLAAGPDGQPLRDDDGNLLFRPGGHGALIENLEDLNADLVFIKNIDNVQPDAGRSATLTWKKTLAGYLLRLQQRSFDLLGRLQEPMPEPQLVEQASEFVRSVLMLDIGDPRRPGTIQDTRALLIDRLNRPLRVCGVVRNTGEPGGGPFWVIGEDGHATPQIVETAQVDAQDPAQQAILRSSTHFNPVDLVCGVSDLNGTPFDLGRFIDPATALITRKSHAGREIRALERPGLWNGAMAGWNTVFVEVPLSTFTPVKSVLDLLRPEHQS